MKAGWSSKPLSEVCDRKPSKSEARRRLADTDKVSFVPMNELGIHQKYFEAAETRPLSSVAGSYTYFADGDVLLAKITPCFENGKLGIARGLENGIGFGSSEFMVLRPKPELLSEYLYYFLDQEPFREVGAKAMTGAVGHKRIPPEFVEALQIPLPPLDEQRRIVAVLDKAFAGIATATANTQKNLTNARALFESTLSEVFDRQGSEWHQVTLSEAGKTVTGNTPKTDEKDNFGDFVPFIKPGNFLPDGSLVYDGDHLSEKGARTSRIVPAGSALMVCIGATIGKSGYAEREITANQQINAVIPRNGVLGKFLYYQFLTPSFQRSVRDSSGQATLPIISKSKWSYLPIRLPSDAKEQISAVDTLDEISEKSEQLLDVGRRKLAALTELKQSLLQKAFAGELT